MISWLEPLPLWVWASAVPLAAALAWIGLRGRPLSAPRRAVLLTLRTAAYALVLALLARPAIPGARIDVSGSVVVAVDVSRSMATRESTGQSRMQQAQSVLSEIGSTLAATAVEVVAVGQGLRPLAEGELPLASGDRTDIVADLEELERRWRGRSLAGVVLLSDGAFTDPARIDTARGGLAMVVPIAMGFTGGQHDREMLSLTAGDRALNESVVDLTAVAVSRGEAAALHWDVLENGRRVEARLSPVAAPAGVPVREVFQVMPPRDVTTLYSVSVRAADDETSDTNDRRALLVGPAARRRVLVVEGAPGFEGSFFKRALMADPALDVDALVRKGNTEDGAPTYYVQAAAGRAAALAAGLPARLSALATYDVIALVNVERSQLGPAQEAALTAFVERRGGGLLVLGSQTFDPGLRTAELASALPVDLDARAGAWESPIAASRGADVLRVVVTPAGETHPAMRLAVSLAESKRRWTETPALASALALGLPRPGASVLAMTTTEAGATVPLVITERFGRGRSMAFAGEASWRWRMLQPAATSTHEVFWRQAVRWLAGDAAPPVTLQMAAVVGPREPIVIRGLVRDADYQPIAHATVEARVDVPGGTSVRLPLLLSRERGVYEGRFVPADVGVFEVRLNAIQNGREAGADRAQVLVGGIDPELADVRQNDGVLRRLAEATGGRLLGRDALHTLPAVLASAQGSAPGPPRELRAEAAAFMLIAVVLGGEWTLRRRWGLR